YLASPGGNFLTGMLLGQLARIFWLKTVAVGNEFFEYVPDFVALKIAPPRSGEVVTRTSELDWQAYSTATRGLSHTPADKLSPARAPRFPSLISDLLITQCDVNVDELEKQETYIRAALTKAAAKGGNREAAERLRNELTSVGRQRAKLEVCI